MHTISKIWVLLLWTQTLSFVKCRDCTLQQFLSGPIYDSNFDTTGMDAMYRAGKQVSVPCNIGYTGFLQLICTEGNWIHKGSKCRPKSCGHPGDAQFADFELEIGDDFVFGSQVLYKCQTGYHMVSRTFRRRCLADGWGGVIPVCEENACEIGVLHPHLFIAGMPPTKKSMNAGHKLRFLCGPDYELDGSEEIECLQTGQWTSSFPTCSGSSGCRTPPPLEDGDTVVIIKQEYEHNEKVQYVCQQSYVMEGGPYKTCNGGVWTGDIRCLKPCTVNTAEMNRRNIEFRYGYENKLYAPHNGYLTFSCKGGTRQVGSESMRRKCTDGQINLPTCQ
ncbi:complement factor H-like [Kryptolebias marmoratus]|uniref:complement factor H-like n=1 Tax=Kryptolebias marmoratus TaxID=37003 RepID=UPI0007F908B5|nr:complement factor H-like [Kryptolebias marmoratus]